MVWLLSVFDLGVVNNLCTDHLYLTTEHNCTGHYLAPAWPQFCPQNLSNFKCSPSPDEELWPLTHIHPLALQEGRGKTKRLLARWIIQNIVSLLGPSYKLIARFSARLKFQAGPSVAITLWFYEHIMSKI